MNPNSQREDLAMMVARGDGMTFEERKRAAELIRQSGPADTASVGETYAKAMNVARDAALEEAAQLALAVVGPYRAMTAEYISDKIRALKNAVPQAESSTMQRLGAMPAPARASSEDGSIHPLRCAYCAFAGGFSAPHDCSKYPLAPQPESAATEDDGK